MGNAKKEIVASLEGMKIVALSDCCELHEYNFVENAWRKVANSARPMERETAESWLSGWNAVDRVEALTLLTAQ